MVAEIHKLEEIEAQGITSSCSAGDSDCLHSVLLEIEFEGASVKSKDVKSKSIVFKGDIPKSLSELGENIYMVGTFIVNSFKVAGRIEIEDERILDRVSPHTIPFFDSEKFPFLFIYQGRGVHLVNVREMTTYPLIHAFKSQGFCIQTSESSFDYHFVCVEEGDLKKE
jgi:hypothetical protein